MPVLERLSAPDLRRAMVRYRDALRVHREELNRLNVYPVPDGDTGTNMTLTLEAVVHELAEAQAMAEVCQAVAHGSLMGARGNSGVILSQVLRGLAETFRDRDAADAADVVAGLRRAADAAYQAVMRPVEGTILTVVRAAAAAAEAELARAAGSEVEAGAAREGVAEAELARAAGSEVEAGAGAALERVLDQAARAAAEALARTPELLPVLKEAGVVDAGARGFTLLLDALLEVVDGRPIPEAEPVTTPPAVARHLARQDVSSLRYEVMFLLEADDVTIPAFKDTWAALGDSIVVVGGDGTWNCHVHTDDVGGAIEAGVEAGRPRAIRVTDLRDEVEEEEEWVRAHAAEPGRAGHDRDVEADDARAGPCPADEEREPVATGVVAVGVGDGVRRLLRSLGVHEVVAGGQSMNPSTAQILEAVERCPASAVVVLPDNKNIVPVARQVDGLCNKQVVVVPTESVVEGLAALVAYDPHADVDDNVTAMKEAREGVLTGEVAQAVRDSTVPGCGPVRAGDWLAITRSGVAAAAPSATDAALALVDSLVTDDSEIVTVVVGADAPPGEAERLRQRVELAHPGIEVEVHEGGQPLYPYLVGVE